MKKIVALFLATVLALGGLIGLFGMGVSAAAAPTVAISAYNVSFRDALCLKFSVTVKNTTAIPQFLYWTKPAAVYDHSTAEACWTRSAMMKRVGLFLIIPALPPDRWETRSTVVPSWWWMALLITVT